MEFFVIGGAGQFRECGGDFFVRIPDLLAQSIDHRAEFGIGSIIEHFHESSLSAIHITSSELPRTGALVTGRLVSDERVTPAPPMTAW
ncbi:hypothetical protein [Streptomyces sp. CC208A]|uniref:hypothetical protein n=1 Tax=Streptomyces sp. CC208A TaxID=3044573 RepID=UPI0024A8EB93|nr:hypothetical protein [Streptomyces sp. CC208A]